MNRGKTGKLVKTHKPNPDRLKKADEVFHINSDVFSMSLDMWRLYEKSWSFTYTGTARAFFERYGQPDAISVRCNLRELEWFDINNELARSANYHQEQR